MSNLLYRTIIVTSSIRVSAETEEELGALSELLCDAADAGYGKVGENLAKHISINAITTDAEICDDEEEEGEEEEDEEDGPNDGSELDEIDPNPGPDPNDELN